MKKYTFMFVAAAMFAACGGNQKPAEEVAEVEAPVEEEVVVELTAEDSAAVAAMFEGQEVSDSCLQAAFDSIIAAKAAAAVETVEEVAEEVAE